MGRCGQQRALHYENDVNDLEEALANGEENLLHGLDLIEQIVALLPDGVDVLINFEEVEDPDEEGIFMSLPREEYTEEECYPEDNDTWRQLQLKSGLVNDQYDDNYDWTCEGDQDEYDGYSTDGTPTPSSRSDQLLQQLSALTFGSGFYYDDPLAQEEIAAEILELEHLVNSEFLGSPLETNHLGMPDEDFKEYCNELEE